MDKGKTGFQWPYGMYVLHTYIHIFLTAFPGSYWALHGRTYFVNLKCHINHIFFINTQLQVYEALVKWKWAAITVWHPMNMYNYSKNPVIISKTFALLSSSGISLFLITKIVKKKFHVPKNEQKKRILSEQTHFLRI